MVLARVNVFDYTCESALFYVRRTEQATDNPSAVNFVPYFAWAGAEIAVAMVCLGIPTLRPLYLRRRGSIGYSSYADRHQSLVEEQSPQFTMIDNKPPIFDPPVRDSSSCHTDVEACRSGSRSGSGSASGSPRVPARPSTAHTRVRPSCYDSVEEIFSMYDQNHPQHVGQNTGLIWVKSEVHVSRRDHEHWPLRN